MRGLARFRRCDPPSPSMCAAASAPRPPPPPRCRRQRPCRLVPKRKRRATTMDLLFEPLSPAYVGSPDISTHCRPTCRRGLHPHAPVGVGPAPRATPPPLPRVGQRFDKCAPLLVSPLWHFPFSPVTGNRGLTSTHARGFADMHNGLTPSPRWLLGCLGVGGRGYPPPLPAAGRRVSSLPPNGAKKVISGGCLRFAKENDDTFGSDVFGGCAIRAAAAAFSLQLKFHENRRHRTNKEPQQK